MNSSISRRYKEGPRMDSGAPLVAVAIDHSKGSQNALKWTIDNLVSRGQTLTLVHVKVTSHPAPFHDEEGIYKEPTDAMRDLFLPFRCFCTRKDVNCKNVLVEETDVCKGLIDFVSHAAVDKLVIGTPSKSGFVVRFKSHEISNNITKGAPDFCTVYIVAKGKVASVKNAIRAAPALSPLRTQIQNQILSQSQSQSQSQASRIHSIHCRSTQESSDVSFSSDRSQNEESIRSPFGMGIRTPSTAKSYEFSGTSDAENSFISSGRPSIDQNPRFSSVSDIDRSFESSRTPMRYLDSSMTCTGNEFSTVSQGSGDSWTSSQHAIQEDVAEEMRRLRQELQQTMNMYKNACKEAVAARQQASQLQKWKIEEEKRMSEVSITDDATVSENEKAKNKAFVEAAKAENRLAELEAQKRVDAEEKGNSSLRLLLPSDLRYRRYSTDEIEEATEYFAEHRKIGEGGYGPVYMCHLDHTPVAVKVLRPDASQGKSQFHLEVEVLSYIRHPHMVLLLGACPEYGCLVYEHMANGSLDDRLFRRGNTPAIPWQHRFRIAAEIATALLFLHRMKPEPLVHRDLKPANILLDRNFVSKIGDVGLARLVPPSAPDTVTQYRMTSTAGTFCYIDPEYQQTGMLGVKSDIYSLGVLLLQLVTAKPAMGLTHHVTRAIENGTIADILDPAVQDWPLAEAQRLAELSLRCAELRKKDRPDLQKVVLPELQKLQLLGEDECMPQWMTRRINSTQSQGLMSEPGCGNPAGRPLQSAPRTNF